MRLFPRISQPTLESFRRDVYRPRLALLLLILLLNGEFPGSTSIATGATLPPSSSSAQTLAASTSSSHGLAAAAWAQWARSELPFAFRQTDEQAKVKKGSTGKRQRKSTPKAAKATATPAAEKREKRQRKSKASTNTSPFQMSTLSIESLFQTQVLSAIVPLHALWLIRLGGMMIEDSIIKSHSHTRAASGGRSQASSLAAIIGLALLAIAVPLVPSSQIFRSAMSYLRKSTMEEEKRSVLPIRAILLLELSATLLSLLCPLMKLNNALLSKYLPTKVLLPSPSHSPPMVELLPLPPGLADIISGRASDVQGRARVGARRGMTAATARPGAAALVLGPVRHGGLGGVATTDGVADEPPTEGQDQRNPARWVNGMQAPLTLPENASAPDGTPLTKAPRRTGVKVEVDASWLLENVVILWGAFVGAVEYLLVVVSLPSLTPASFPPVVALLSLRSQISAMTLTWTSSRRAVECLEFVRRRWVATTSNSSQANVPATAPPTATTPSSSSPAATTRRWQPDQHDDVSCPICFELIRPSSSSSAQEADERVGAESCRLDCGHELHAVCLVQIFLGNKQAYCPCCHDPLKATPPNAQAGGAGGDDGAVPTAAAQHVQ